MTYKTAIPPRVIARWRLLNPNYRIDFSLDRDCIVFLNKHFGKGTGDLFRSIEKGMYKADLWRLCKLYVNGGIYADVDLVPYMPLDELLNLGHTFYTALSKNSGRCFQAIIIATPRNPIVLSCIYSLCKNRPFAIDGGPYIRHV